MKPVIAISMGDFNGIGPEVILKSSDSFFGDSTPLLLGHHKPFQFYAEKLGITPHINMVTSPDEVEEDKLNLLQISDKELKPEPGKLSAVAGKLSMEAVEAGVKLCLQNKASALVTAPISKEAITLAGYNVPGHTDFLAQETNTDFVLMMLVSGSLRVALVTAHIPVRDISTQITKEKIERSVRALYKSLKDDFSINQPKIAVFGLNPHSGDGGVIGMEEIEIIGPAIEELSKEIEGIEGPFAADGFFGQKMQNSFDGILAMYHDQGLAPFKALSFGKGVNFTAGLPIIRTSPDHGTAFSIAGMNKANQQSFTEAYKLAVKLSLK